VPQGPFGIGGVMSGDQEGPVVQSAFVQEDLIFFPFDTGINVFSVSGGIFFFLLQQAADPLRRQRGTGKKRVICGDMQKDKRVRTFFRDLFLKFCPEQLLVSGIRKNNRFSGFLAFFNMGIIAGFPLRVPRICVPAFFLSITSRGVKSGYRSESFC